MTVTQERKTCIVAVVYSEEKIERFRFLLRKYSEMLSVKNIIFISNNKNLNFYKYINYFTSSGINVKCAFHDNSGAEFGAYQKGLEMARDAGTDLYIFINDTAGIHNFLGKSFVVSLKKILSDPAKKMWCFGICNVAERRFTIGKFSSNRWIQSHFFAMDSATLDVIDHSIYAPEINNLVTETPDIELFLANLSDRNLRSYIEGWLFAASGTRWYGAEPLTQNNLSRFALKTRSILQEKYLSMRMDSKLVAFYSPSAKLPQRVIEKIARRLFKLRLLR